MRALGSALLVAASIPAFAAAAPKAKPKAFPVPFETHSLPNGLRIVLIPYDSPGLVAYYTLMRVGSRNEPEKGRSGYAHFFEHMMFRGTKKHSGEDYTKTITRLGLDMNAFTSDDETVYHLFGPAKALPTIIELESDRFQNLDYSEAQFKTEAGAILGEYAKSASNPEQQLEEKMMETAFDAHTYRHTTIGYIDDVKAMPSGFAYSREFFRRYYTPDNATVIVCGDFDKAQALDLLTKAYSPWTGKLDPAPVAAEPPHKEPRTAHVDWKTPTLPRLWMAWHAPTDLKSAATQRVLNAYLFGETSPLYQDLILGRQLVDSLEPTFEDHRDPYLFGVLARVKEKKELPTVEKAVLDRIAELAQGKVDAERLAAVRSNVKYTVILRLNTVDLVAVSLARATAPTGELDHFDKLFAEVDALKPADLTSFAKQYLIDANRTEVTLSTKGGAR
jgi:zinc protease